MNLKWYWTKIALGALTIFGVGMVAFNAMGLDRQRHRIRHSFYSADVHVPPTPVIREVAIPMSRAAFRFNGKKVGSLQLVEVSRNEPRSVANVILIARVSDTEAINEIQACRLTFENAGALDESTSFRCASGDEPLEPIGHVVLYQRDQHGQWVQTGMLNLGLSPDSAAQFRNQGTRKLESQRLAKLADSIKVLSLSLAKAATEAERNDIQSRLQYMEQQLAWIREALSTGDEFLQKGNDEPVESSVRAMETVDSIQ